MTPCAHPTAMYLAAPPAKTQKQSALDPSFLDMTPLIFGPAATYDLVAATACAAEDFMCTQRSSMCERPSMVQSSPSDVAANTTCCHRRQHLIEHSLEY